MLELIEKYGITILEADDEANRMANIYIQEGIIPVTRRLDSAHIAIATEHKLDCILSFNFRHINRLKTKSLTAYINARENYRAVLIVTPEEVFRDEEA